MSLQRRCAQPRQHDASHMTLRAKRHVDASHEASCASGVRTHACVHTQARTRAKLEALGRKTSLVHLPPRISQSVRSRGGNRNRSTSRDNVDESDVERTRNRNSSSTHDRTCHSYVTAGNKMLPMASQGNCKSRSDGIATTTTVRNDNHNSTKCRQQVRTCIKVNSHNCPQTASLACMACCPLAPSAFQASTCDPAGLLGQYYYQHLPNTLLQLLSYDLKIDKC